MVPSSGSTGRCVGLSGSSLGDGAPGKGMGREWLRFVTNMTLSFAQAPSGLKRPTAAELVSLTLQRDRV